MHEPVTGDLAPGSPDLSPDLVAIEADGQAAIASASDLEGLEEAERSALGKRSALAARYQGLGGLDESARRSEGRSLHEIRARLEQQVAKRREQMSARARSELLEADRLDLTEVLPGDPAGHLHLVTLVREELEDVFVAMGYEIAEGPEAETSWRNFDALNIGEGHPARSPADTFYLAVGEEGSTLLRPQTSPVQIRLLERGELPIYAVAPGRTYRRDTPDASHLPVFHQIEGLVVDRGVSFGDMKGTISTFVQALFGPSVTTRLRPAYFPFTEPSAEFEMSCVICGGTGCRTCAGVGWIELGGCGMVHPAVFENTGVDPEEWTGFAFGFGIDRLAIMRHGVADLRSFIENDVRFLTQF